MFKRFDRLIGGLVLAMTIAAHGCGPTCPEAKAALGAGQMMAGDVARVNALVKRRKAAIATAEQGGLDSFEMQRIKFSVTAYELAAKVQLRIIKLSPHYEDSDQYGKNQDMINDARCLIDDLLAGEGHRVPDGIGRRVQRVHDQFTSQIRDDGEVSGSEFATYLEEGIKASAED